MSREIPYEQQTLSHPNPVARYAHQARYRKSLALLTRLVPEGGTILDFGAGEGELLHRLAALRTDIRLLAVEPYMKIKYPEILNLRSLEKVENDSIDLLCAFETLEHISGQQVDIFVAQAIRICRTDAKIVVSVPIMHGPLLPLKELSRCILFRRLSEYSLAELMRGVCGLRIERASNLQLSHKGFDYRLLRDRLGASFKAIEEFYSPYQKLPWWCNSQVFFVFAPKGS